MARAEWGHSNNGRGGNKWWSYKRTTVVICCMNIGVALYVLYSLYTSLYNYPYYDTQKAARYSQGQIRKMEESIRIRKESEPIELIKLVKQIKEEFLKERRMVNLPLPLKHKITDEIVERLQDLDPSANATEQQEAVERWRREKLKEAKKVKRGQALNSNILPEEAGMLAKALKSNWAELSEEIGLWIPVEIITKEHDDKPEGEEEFDDSIIPGRQLPPECHAKLHTDYDGAAVRWGLTHHKESAYECCQACLDHAKTAKPGENKCNIWVYCPSEGGCYSPDIYEHKLGECWLKYAENPRVNFKDRYSDSYRNSHPNSPVIVPWVSGIVSA
ncbi:hypothetical protein RJ640_020268 [Escallonia rubra]|uniref:Uncharacterized protein n=1 Tax=Escallonia rubra TaxID=112253 RepID=A0AA88SJB9_9ASTE|nr:hypothetical protein RJ640_020268 [Escallonia rubra]